MYAVFFVLDNPDLLDDVLDAWYAAGIGGVTIFESTGFHRRQHQHIAMRYLFGGENQKEQGNLDPAGHCARMKPLCKPA